MSAEFVVTHVADSISRLAPRKWKRRRSIAANLNSRRKIMQLAYRHGR